MFYHFTKMIKLFVLFYFVLPKFEFKEFELRLKTKPQLKYGWLYLNIQLKFIKFGHWWHVFFWLLEALALDTFINKPQNFLNYSLEKKVRVVIAIVVSAKLQIRSTTL